MPALHELRRIHCKHLLEVFASPETRELYEHGCIAGRYAKTADADRPTSFIVEAVTPLGLATLNEHDRSEAPL